MKRYVNYDITFGFGGGVPPSKDQIIVNLNNKIEQMEYEHKVHIAEIKNRYLICGIVISVLLMIIVKEFTNIDIFEV